MSEVEEDKKLRGWGERKRAGEGRNVEPGSVAWENGEGKVGKELGVKGSLSLEAGRQVG